ncbi:tetratricopeptide repeat protein 1-like [Octopus sinensis]|uniref:Tetratricopeptide repeat protein 1-like n=1 Tax=Octopus sinensis TaxID=2607531 RepID=A0A7E6EJ22_9MOLL|nr:tetratricopeptide repeat protein 1-like [Octopus sinensis]XP_036355591.1 tetratricopeptide repeat protein 1-like [Octopus sinensis]XP_036355752.1 tetratricopeptide repeat protein 1-like [Octopus sinensis]
MDSENEISEFFDADETSNLEEINEEINVELSPEELDSQDSEAIEKCTNALEFDPNYIKAYLLRAKLYEKTEKLEDALKDYKKVLELDPKNQVALKGNFELPPLIETRNEKLKTEAMGWVGVLILLAKLKELGNMVLKPFGLSTDNFKFDKDKGGGYSVNFQK